MPIYEYQCDACGHALEALQKMSDAPLVSCPECKNDTLRKKVSAAAFRLKGGGWYETDFKSGNKKNLAGSDEGKSASNSSKASEVTSKSGGKPSTASSSSSGSAQTS